VILIKLLKPLACLFLFFVIVAVLPARALAWGDKGHRIIALIATDRLSPGARQAVAELLGRDETLDSVAGWADKIRVRGKDTAKLHRVDIPLERSYYDASRDCPGEDCVIAAVEQQIRILRERSSGSDRNEALRLLIHLIGDLHQPFHVTTNSRQSVEGADDDGANKVKVISLRGRPMSLHAFWDDELVNYAIGDSQLEYYAAELAMRAKRGNQSSQGSVTDWAIETHRLAWGAYVPTADNYFMLADGKPWELKEYYYDKNRQVMETQLIRAGVRLAKTLNDLFGGKAAY
jgi:hypothetical protein